MVSTPPLALRMSSFQGTQNLPLVVADRLGYFYEHGLKVQLSYTTGSAVQLAALAAGECDLVQTAPDNVIHYAVNPEAFGVPHADAPRIVILMSGSNGPLALYARPGITSVAQLRGATLGVDNPGSGFALVLRDLLASRQLVLDRDYTIAPAGGTAARCEALIRGEIAGTVLYLPYDIRAAVSGCVELASSRDAYPAYASLAIAGRLDWVAAHGAAVTALLRALLRAQAWLRRPEHTEQVGGILRDVAELGVDPASVDVVMSRMMHDGGLSLGASDDAGVRQVIAIRSRLVPSRATLGEPQDYCDLTWYRAALQSLGA
jgi:ABC-type nitrate/sulfonate/bicarbonate transport system substrate-binding protein